MAARCACGCGQRGAHRHHCVYKQELKWHAERRGDGTSFKALAADERNLVLVAFDCHLAHHKARKRYRLSMLPDSVFEFALEVLTAGPAYNYLRRHYQGEDPRLEEMVGLHLSGR
jgi:hypothetical protein